MEILGVLNLSIPRGHPHVEIPISGPGAALVVSGGAKTSCRVGIPSFGRETMGMSQYQHYPTIQKWVVVHIPTVGPGHFA